MSNALVQSQSARLQRQAAPRLDDAQTAQFFEMLGAMSTAGIPLVKALDGLSEQPGLVRPLSVTVRALESGHSLTRAFSLGGFKDPMVLGLLHLGENTGTMSKVIAELAQLFRWRARIKSEITSRLTYPVILAVACSLLVGLGPPLLLKPILEFVAQSGGTVPTATRLVMGLVAAMSSAWFWVMVAGLMTLLWSGLALCRKRWPDKLEAVLGRSPAGRFMNLLHSVRLGKALASGLSTGYPLLAGMELAARCSGSHVMVEEGRRACSRLIGGAAPEQAFAEFKSLDPLIRQAIVLGLASGTVEALLGGVLQLQEDRLRYELERALALLEPVLLGFMGVMVGLCILATVSPMMSLLQGVM